MNNANTILTFDGTFESFLSAVYTAFNEGLEVVDIRPETERNSLLFNEIRYIPADRQKARWVWDWLNHKGTADLRLVYFSFLSEKEELWLPLIEFITLLFQAGVSESSKRLTVLRGKLAPWAKRVEREKQKLETHLKFKSRQCEYLCCHLRPVYDVLPLLTRFCREHFGSDPWMLVDTKRNYGLYNKTGVVEHFGLQASLSGLSATNSGNSLQEQVSEDSPSTLEPLQEAV